MKQEIIPISLGNVKAYLIKSERWVLVDTGFSFSYRKLVKTLFKYNIKPSDISLIVITHNHLDHVGGLIKIQKLTNAKVLLQKLDGAYLKKGISSDVKPVTIFAKILFKLFKPSKHIKFEPHIEFDDEMDLGEYGIKGKVLHTPGHTDGSLSVILDNGDTIVGDLINGNKNKAKYFYVINDFNLLKTSLKTLLDKGAKRFFTSHKNVCEKKAVEELLNIDSH